MKENDIIDLVPQAEKITDEQLKDLQGLIGEINNAQLSVGQLETQKAGFIAGIGDLQMKLKSMQEKLEGEYGKVTINIQDGSIKEIEDESDPQD